jgi:4-carboxymuconolactone decarboxylase
MTRLPELNQRDLVPEDARPVFDEIMASRGRITPTFGVMLHSPQVAQRAAHLGTYMRFESSLEVPHRELAALAAAHLCQCAYEWGQHQAPARTHGVSEAAIAALGSDGPLGDLDPTEALIISFARQILTTHQLEEATFAAARERFGDRGAVDLTATLGYYSMIACILNAAGVPAAQ